MNENLTINDMVETQTSNLRLKFDILKQKYEI